MGNTGVALGRDGAAPFVNPATIVGIDDRSIAFSVNFLALQNHRFARFHRPGPVDARFGNVDFDGTSVWSRRVTALPDTICLFIAFSALTAKAGTAKEDPTPWEGGRQKFAVCLATLESDDLIVPSLMSRGRTPSGTTTQDASFARKWTRAQVGPTYSAQINEKLSLGASLQGAYTSMSFIHDASSLSAAADGSATQSALGMAGDGNSLDLTAILGATYELGGLVFGASVQLPALHLLGSYDATLHRTFNTADSSEAILASGSGNFHAAPSTRISFGIGRTKRTWSLEGDASFDFGRPRAVTSSMETQTVTLANDTLSTAVQRAGLASRTSPTLNGAIGGEYFVTPRLSVLGGAFTNLSALPALKAAPVPSLGNVMQARAHHVGVSFGLGSYSGDGELLFGTQLGYGWGEMLAPNLYAAPPDWSVIKTQSYSALFVLAGATNLRSIKRAIEGVKNAVTPGPAGDAKPPATSR